MMSIGQSRAQMRALDAALLVEPEHAAEAVGRLPALLGILDRHLLLEQVGEGDAQAREQVEQHHAIEDSSDGAHAFASF